MICNHSKGRSLRGAADFYDCPSAIRSGKHSYLTDGILFNPHWQSAFDPCSMPFSILVYEEARPPPAGHLFFREIKSISDQRNLLIGGAL